MWGFLAYKQGASVIGYIARRYGRRKIGEILGKGQVYIQPDRAMLAALGRTQDELYEEWLNLKKREYFPEFALRQRPEGIAEKGTDHEKDGSYFNVMPSFSPDGHRVAFISNRKDYIDLYIIDIITGKIELIAAAERSGTAQSFHPFRSRPGWSHDGKFLAFSRKSGGSDEIAIIDNYTKKLRKAYSYNGIREIASPTVLPGDTALVFSGLRLDRTDLYLAHIDGGEPIRLTSDRWDDKFPTVSPDGRYIAFASDRPISENIDVDIDEAQGQMASGKVEYGYPYGSYNIFILDLVADTIAPLTSDGEGNDQPAWFQSGDRIAYTSERNGIRNIWIAERGDSIVHRPYTDLLSGAFSPTWDPDGEKLVFSGFYEGGFDLYYMKELSPLDSITVTPYILSRDTLCPAEELEIDLAEELGIKGDLRNIRIEPEDDPPGVDMRLYTPEPYKPEFSIDMISGAIAYDTYYGFRGLTQIMFSDVLGNHQVIIATDLFDDIANSTVYVSYGYFTRRFNYGFTGYHYKNYFWPEYDEYYSDRVFGGALRVEYPFSQYNRIQLFADGFFIDREYYNIPEGSGLEDMMPFNLMLELSAVRDNSLWKSTGPVRGSRFKAALQYVPKIDGNSMDYVAGRIDLRKYFHFGSGYGFAARLSAGSAHGDNKPVYWLGGSDNWLNWVSVDRDYTSIGRFYFSNMIMPLRGHTYFAYEGNSYGLINLELRYPFIERMDLGLPPITIGGINGAFFTDFGAVAGENLSEFRGVKDGKLNDFKMGVGFGARAWVWWFLLYYDLAWETDLNEIAHKPVHHFGLGTEF